MWFIFRKYGNIASWHGHTTVYPKKYAHGFCFAVLCCGYTLTDFPISIKLTSLALWQSNDCPSASKATLMNMDKYVMWIHYERLHNHKKAKHNKTVCIFLGLHCIRVCRPLWDESIHSRWYWYKIEMAESLVYPEICLIVDWWYSWYSILFILYMFLDTHVLWYLYQNILYQSKMINRRVLSWHNMEMPRGATHLPTEGLPMFV